MRFSNSDVLFVEDRTFFRQNFSWETVVTTTAETCSVFVSFFPFLVFIHRLETQLTGIVLLHKKSQNNNINDPLSAKII